MILSRSLVERMWSGGVIKNGCSMPVLGMCVKFYSATLFAEFGLVESMKPKPDSFLLISMLLSCRNYGTPGFKSLFNGGFY